MRSSGRTNHSLRVLVVCLVALGFAPLEAHATRWFVESGGDGVAFSPQFLTIQVGDTVTFMNKGGYHNVVADDGSFRCAHGCDGDGQGGSGNASDAIWFATVAFPTAGTVGYFCEPHGSPGSGMYGTIEVVAAPPPAPVVPAPSGNVKIDGLLAFAVTLVALMRLRRIARSRAVARPRQHS